MSRGAQQHTCSTQLCFKDGSGGRAGHSPNGQLKAIGSEGGLLGSGQVDRGVGHHGVQAATAARQEGRQVAQETLVGVSPGTAGRA